MKITKLSLRELKIPLRYSFAQSNNAGTKSSQSVILQIEDESGIIAFGEACPRTYVTGESVQSVQSDLLMIANDLYHAQISSWAAIKSLLSYLEQKGIGPSTACLIELALLDLLAKRTEQSISSILQLSTDKKLQYSLVLPLSSSNRLSQLLDHIPAFDPIAIKIKVDNRHQNNLERIQLLQQQFNAPIRVDVNGGWTKAEALAFMPDLIDLGVVCFEECLPLGGVGGMKEVMHQFGKEIDLMADESITSISDAKKLIEQRTVSAFNIKISKVGGLHKALAIHQLAKENGITCQLGAHYGESSILSRAGLAFATSPGVHPMYLEGSFGKWLLKDSIIPSPVTHTLKGKLDVLSNFPKNGLISDLIFDKLDQHSQVLIRLENKKMFVC